MIKQRKTTNNMFNNEMRMCLLHVRLYTVDFHRSEICRLFHRYIDLFSGFQLNITFKTRNPSKHIHRPNIMCVRILYIIKCIWLITPCNHFHGRQCLHPTNHPPPLFRSYATSLPLSNHTIPDIFQYELLLKYTPTPPI